MDEVDKLVATEMELSVWRERRRFVTTLGRWILVLILAATASGWLLMTRWLWVREKEVSLLTAPLPKPHFKELEKKIAAPEQGGEPALSTQAYLAELQSIEMERRAIVGDFKVPARKAGLEDYQRRFMSLLERLRQLKPPSECHSLHQSYEQAIEVHVGVMQQLSQDPPLEWHWDAIDEAQARPLPSGAILQIETALSAADSALSSLCSRLGICKPFSICQEAEAGS